MAGTYGEFLASFPELFQSVIFWTYEGNKRVDLHTERVVILNKAVESRQWKGTEGVYEVSDNDYLYAYKTAKLKRDMCFMYKQVIYKLGDVYDFEKAGGYNKWVIQRVQGPTPDKTGKLEIKKW